MKRLVLIALAGACLAPVTGHAQRISPMQAGNLPACAPNPLVPACAMPTSQAWRTQALSPRSMTVMKEMPRLRQGSVSLLQKTQHPCGLRLWAG